MDKEREKELKERYKTYTRSDLIAELIAMRLIQNYQQEQINLFCRIIEKITEKKTPVG